MITISATYNTIRILLIIWVNAKVLEYYINQNSTKNKEIANFSWKS